MNYYDEYIKILDEVDPLETCEREGINKNMPSSEILYNLIEMRKDWNFKENDLELDKKIIKLINQMKNDGVKILTIDEKEQETKKIVQLLSQEKPHSLKELHNIVGYDFEKPYGVFSVVGRFTINKLFKHIDDPNNKTISIIVDNPDRSYMRYCLAIYNHNTLVTSFRDSGNSGCRFNAFSSKVSFEQTRKQDDIVTYVIYQDNAYLRRHKPVEFNPSERFLISEYIKYARIYNVYGYQNGLRMYYNPQINTRDINEIFDKSGYCVELSRRSLRNRGKIYRDKVRKAQYEATDYSATIEDLRLLIEKKRLEIIENIENVKNYEQIEQLSYDLSHLATAMRYFDNLEAKDKSKSYNSIKDFDYDYDYIVNRLNHI